MKTTSHEVPMQTVPEIHKEMSNEMSGGMESENDAPDKQDVSPVPDGFPLGGVIPGSEMGETTETPVPVTGVFAAEAVKAYPR